MSSARPAPDPDAELAAEQGYVTGLHRRLDDIRAQVVGRLDDALASVAHNPQAVGEREATVQLYTERLVALDAAESGLCFGRLDRRDATVPRYVGRIGLQSEDGGEEPLLVDWRAPAAQPFYTATPLHDLGVRRRRHIRTRGRTVVSIADETLDLDDPDVAQRSGLAGESVLLAALNQTRTGRMTDIVRTIQAEQDRIIRADHRGVLVVQGGPGTGKTAVALHRAAYLLYTHRERLARSGLLIVGPSPTFLRYIADVLPSLGETGVVLADLGSLRPGLPASAPERPEVAEVKGRAAMADVVAAAVTERQAVPDGPVEVTIDGTTLRLTPTDAARARTRARAASRLHNEARPTFARRVIDRLTQKYADKLGADVRGGSSLLDAADVAALRREVAAEPAVHALIDRLWPRLTPERLLRDLFASRDRLVAATPGWDDADRDLLLRSPSAPWTPADVPLLDEADELLGVDESGERTRAR
ncbi:MAG TPA: helicase, partial [Blastococcus sp.]|nr:helicase [Blastococcus sp.]